jgi:hypothetical protein
LSNPRTTLAAITHLTDDIRAAWPRFEQTIAALGNSTIPGRLDTGSHGGDIPDPVYAANIPDEWDEVAAELDETRGHLTHILSVVQRIAREDPETARHHEAAARAARCSEPACEELAVKDGLCFRDWQAHETAPIRRHA